MTSPKFSSKPSSIATSSTAKKEWKYKQQKKTVLSQIPACPFILCTRGYVHLKQNREYVTCIREIEFKCNYLCCQRFRAEKVVKLIIFLNSYCKYYILSRKLCKVACTWWSTFVDKLFDKSTQIIVSSPWRRDIGESSWEGKDIADKL